MGIENFYLNVIYELFRSGQTTEDTQASPSVTTPSSPTTPPPTTTPRPPRVEPEADRVDDALPSDLNNERKVLEPPDSLSISSQVVLAVAAILGFIFAVLMCFHMARVIAALRWCFKCCGSYRLFG